jgi:hypothetical protein
MADMRYYDEARGEMSDACWTLMGLGEDDESITRIFQACLKDVRADHESHAKREASLSMEEILRWGGRQ